MEKTSKTAEGLIMRDTRSCPTHHHLSAHPSQATALNFFSRFFA